MPNTEKELQKQQIIKFTVELHDPIPSVDAWLTKEADPGGG